jgi:hypothetical protein
MLSQLSRRFAVKDSNKQAIRDWVRGHAWMAIGAALLVTLFVFPPVKRTVVAWWQAPAAAPVCQCPKAEPAKAKPKKKAEGPRAPVVSPQPEQVVPWWTFSKPKPHPIGPAPWRPARDFWTGGR